MASVNQTLQISPDKVASSAAVLKIGKAVEAGLEIQCTEGSVIAVQALEEKLVYDSLELPDGRMAKIIKGDIIIGVLGGRNALKGFVGKVPSSAKVGDTLHILNLGGVIGTCVSENKDVGHPLQVKVLGQVLASGKPANIKDFSLPLAHSISNSAPLVLVSGTCMSAGKTLAACHIIRGMKHAGMKVAAGKVTGVSLKRDVLAMEDYGAEQGLYFTDFGYPSTTSLADVAPVAKGMIHELNKCSPDAIVLELGDGLLGGYGVLSILKDPQIRKATAAHVLCANDPVAAYGGKLLCDKLGFAIDIVAGPVTDNIIGTQFVEAELSLQGINARTDGVLLSQAAMSKVKKFSLNGGNGVQ